MASNTMNFGPEWMRRFPAKSNQSADQNPRAPSPPASSHQDWNQPASSSTSSAMPAFSYSSIAASNVRSQNGASSQTSSFEASQSDGAGVNSSGTASNFGADSLNPFKYSKDLMLQLYKPTGLPIEFERHEYMTSEESLPPISFQKFSEQEVKLLAGSVNSEVARRTTQPGDGTQERTPGQRRESFSNNGEHSTSRYDRSDKSSTHSRNFESRSHGAGTRPRNLNTEGRSHSFRRTEQIDREREREKESEDDGLWNSPVGNTVGSFDANGVFRVVGDGDELQSLGELEKPTSKHSVDDPKPASNSSAPSQLQEPASSDQGPSKVDQPSPQQQQQPPQDIAGENFLFSNTLLSGKGPLREDAEFAPFSQTSGSGVASASEPVFEPVPIELSKWLYRDPTGSIQGPFPSEDMHEWYKGGFFNPELLVKREQDPTFEPLGTLIRKIGSEDKPFLLAGAARQEQPTQRPTVPSLAQNRQPNSQMGLASGWVGMSAPSTPSTPSFGVDRHLMQQQQQQQQHSSGDLFSSTNSIGQQRAGFGLDPSAGGPGAESRWSSNLFGRNMEAGGGGGGGWGDSFSRTAAPSISSAHTTLGGGGPHFIDQQQRLHTQEIERQQFLQMLQRQSQMQAIVHQQQFMTAQQQFGNDPHALAALLAQQQAQQRQLQMRYQQLQYGLHAQAVSTPGGTAVPWGGMGMGQPSSPWTSSIIPTSSDYFDYTKGDGSQGPQPTQHQRQQGSQPQTEHQQFQSTQQDEQQLLHQQQDESAFQQEQSQSSGSPSLEYSATADVITERMENLEVQNEAKKDHLQIEHEAEAELIKESALVANNSTADNEVFEEREEPPKSRFDEAQENEEEESIIQQTENEFREEYDEDRHDHDSAEENVSETASSTTAESAYRTIKASPAPWAKPTNVDEEPSERKGPTLREIQEMEAKKAEEAKAERQAQLAVAASTSGGSVLDFTKGMSGAPAWSSAASTTPKKKTLKEIQQEEEAAMKKARAAAAAQQSTVASIPLGNPSTGLAAIVASGTGPSGRRYADTIGPKPAASSTTSGAWGSATTSISGSRPTVATRGSSVLASNSSLNSPSGPASRSADNSWIEVGSKYSSSAASSPAVSRTSTNVPSAPASSKPSSFSNSNEPRPPSEDFMRWCRQALKDLQGVVLEDFIQMLLTFPLNPDPMTVEIISESIYANSKSLNGRQFADEFTKRRKADAFPNGAPASMGSNTSSNSGAGASDSSFKVVSKKSKKKGTA
ncbi:hypothetical protein BGZ76_011045 [Entomortierella beljakovae]|nr:hypothetical protein BGZ76_011045 [Entomortierella beljakovae]